ncbi:glycoprotein endo-alpha-1,2-mannosidase-like [Lytechinus variegatus]|uniref:glycoprotein endo-alpha-1,2-mannosidase-like n=1 Tax=Lytechinus variegatus TaxID=7654 RepID=UPI001BB13B7E|nr:glycoprotein endo-alpha-1,2-mannosidase-like [Lytechinus variegatus]XP_041462900.1 glycoprotein endo-alpha-1,2-mannosidase-like [Lytechinus variegatus]XP_041462901.1 glycoprotein endo-alpha-1,2-mannosidase-like [Lytechinus variegatus]
MALCRNRKVCRVVSAIIVITFLGGCFMAISNLMTVDSDGEIEAARNVVQYVKKEGALQRDESHDYNARGRLKGHSDKEQSPQEKSKILQIHEVVAKGRNKTHRSGEAVKLLETLAKKENTANRTDAKISAINQEQNLAWDDPATWPPPNYNLHAFYYPWYGTPGFDGMYLHWNHPLLPHWNKDEAKKWPSGSWKPPGEIGANFYPQLGPYSSRDPAVIEDHMKQLRLAGIGVISMSWYPAGLADDQGKPIDDMMPTYLNIAHKYGIKITFHSEPYKGRSEVTFRDDVRYIIDNYGSHPAFYRYKFKGRHLPMFYVYDSYHTSSSSWARLFGINDELSVRNTIYDGIFLGLYLDAQHRSDILESLFDGFYTYFASSGFTYGSRWKNWKLLADFAQKRNLLFVPSVGPGYVDTQIRPWNDMNTKHRANGDYYERSLQAATKVKPDIISVTSFNEWHEGTQIERAVPKKLTNFTYLDYGPDGPNKYLLLTQKWSKTFKGKG